MATLTATWQQIPHLPIFPRSAHTLSILYSSLHLFSGQQPTPISAELHILPLNPAIPIAITILASPLGPPPRIGAASAVLDNTLYVFGGRGGGDGTLLEEGGRMWSFSVGGQTWTALDPSDENAPFPEGRCHHGASAALGKIYIHGGCAEGGFLGDLWSFDLGLKRWERLSDAPGNVRGGMGFAVTGSREIWRFGGYGDGMAIGDAVDVYDIPSNRWRSIPYSHGPNARSASCLVPVKHPKTRREYLITAFGEHGSSNLDQSDVDKLLDDVWAYDIATSEWTEVNIFSEERPEPRTRFVAGGVGGDDGQGVVMQGGLSTENKNLGDWWLLMLE